MVYPSPNTAKNTVHQSQIRYIHTAHLGGLKTSTTLHKIIGSETMNIWDLSPERFTVQLSLHSESYFVLVFLVEIKPFFLLYLKNLSIELPFERCLLAVKWCKDMDL